MNLKAQQGMSMLGMLTTVVLVASILLLAIKIIPLYIDDYAIANALEAVIQEEDIVTANKKQVQASIVRRLSADYTRDLKDDEIIITKEKDKTIIDVVYEARVPIAYNLDIVAKFEHRVEASK